MLREWVLREGGFDGSSGNMTIRSSRIRRCVRENRRSCFFNNRLHTGHAEALSRTSEPAPAPFPVHHGTGWDGLLE